MDFEISWDKKPTTKTKKTEKYSFPVLTLSAIDSEAKGVGRKLSFNKAAQGLLGLVGEDILNFGIGINRAFVRKSTTGEGKKLTKTFTINDKKTYENLISLFNLSSEQEQTFSIEKFKDSIFELFPFDASSTTAEVAEEPVLEVAVVDPSSLEPSISTHTESLVPETQSVVEDDFTEVGVMDDDTARESDEEAWN